MNDLNSSRNHFSSRISSVEIMLSRLLNGGTRNVIGLVIVSMILVLVILRFLLDTDSALLLSPINNMNGNCPFTWHGGSPKFNTGSCWCGEDGYCMCTPSLAIDVIIEVLPSEHLTNTRVRLSEVSVMLIKRRDPPRDLYAIPGGFVRIGESVEQASVREMWEEVHIEVMESDLRQFHVYSDPNRDKRRHTVSSVNIVTLAREGHGIRHMHSGDDAKEIRIIPVANILLDMTGHIPANADNTHGIPTPTGNMLDMAFDHREIITDYVKMSCDQQRYIECGFDT